MKSFLPKTLFIALQLLIVHGLNAQNLVPNPNFENFSSCPTGPGQINVLDNWITATGGTPDYFNVCYNGGPGASVDVPNNYVGNHGTLSGDGYVGIFAQTESGLKEYIQVDLTQQLWQGECYEIEMFISPAYGALSNLAINHIGMHLSLLNSQPTPGPDGNIFVEPQIFYPEIVTDQSGWVSITGTYLAQGGEAHLTIGNFSPNGYYNTESLGPPLGPEASYYYIENVRVELAQEPGDQYLLAVTCDGECVEYNGNQYCDEGTYQIPINEPCNDIMNLAVYYKQATTAVIAEPEVLECDIVSIFLNANGSSSGPGFNYEWSGPNNFESTELNPEVFDPGIYTLIVDGPGMWCPTTLSVEVFEEIIPPDISIEVIGTLGCSNSPVIISGSSSNPNVTYEWTGPNNFFSDDPSTEVFDPGSYILTISTIRGCINSDFVFLQADLSTPDIAAESDGIIDCNNLVAFLIGSSDSPNVSYQWFGPGASANTPNTVTAVSGIYTFIVTGSNGCTSSVDVIVEDDLETPDVFAEVIGELDCNTFSVPLSGGSETEDVSYFWSGPGIETDQPDTIAYQPGIYTFTVTGPNGCIDSTNITVIEDSTGLEIEAMVDGILTCENDTVTLTGNTNTPNVSYQWTGPGLLDTIAVIEVDQPGEYILSISSDSGCTADTTILVEQNIESPTIVINAPDSLNCNTLSVDLNAGNSTGIGILNFEWQNGNGDVLGNDSVLNVTTSGIYNIILSDSENGCSEQSTIEVFGDSETPVSVAEASGELNCDNVQVTLDGSNSTGDPLSFQWLDENNDVISNDTFVDVSIAGIYTLLVSNTANGCTTTSTIEIESNTELPIAIAETIDLLDCNNIEATLDGNGSSEGNNISYEWQNPSGDSIANTLQTLVDAVGVYTLIVFNEENGCSSSSLVEVFQDIETPVAVAGDDQMITCNETTVTLDGSASSSSGNLTFQWTNSNNEIISSSEIVEVDVEDIYTLTVIAENGCSASDEIEVTLDTNVPTADPGSGGTLDCAINSISLGGSGTSNGNNITYQWLDENNNEISVSSTTDITIPGTYTLIVTNISNNCSNSASIVIPQDIETPTANAGNNATLNCLLTETQLDGSQSSSGQNFEYQWLNSLSVIISNEATTLTNLPDTYTLIVTNTVNSCTAESTVIIDQNIDTPSADAGNDGTLSCDINEISLDGSGSSGNNLSFEWFDQSQISVGNQAIIQVSEPGIYDLIVTNTVSGCSAQSGVEIISDENLPTAIAIADDLLTCENTLVTIDGSASTSVSGNIEFEWLDENGNVISMLESAEVNAIGIYTLIVTDTDNGCTVSTTVEIQQDIETPFADAGQNQTLICGQTDLTLDATGSTGSNLSFEWQDDNGNTIATTVTTSVSSVGTYFLFVTNTVNGCSSSASVEVIPDVDLPTAIAIADDILTCENNQVTIDGSASSTGTNIEYEWQNSVGDVISTNQTTIINLPGTYTLYVLDTNNNCLAQDNVIVVEDITPPVAFINTGSSTDLDCNNSSTVLDGTGSSPANQLDFLWTTNDGNIFVGEENTPNPEVDAQGTYVLTVTSLINGCTASTSIFVNQDITPPTANINSPQVLTCNLTEFELDASGSSSGGTISYSWTSSPSGGIISGADSSNPLINQTGDFTIIVFDAGNGCQSSAVITVGEDITAPDAVANVDDQFDCVTESITLDGTGSSVGPEFIYNWSGNSTIDNSSSLVPTVYEPGLYTILVTDMDNGCTESADVVVSQSEEVPSAADIQVADPLCYGDPASIAIVSVTGGDGPYLYSIDGGENFSSSNFFNALSPGTYDILIQDAKGCEYEDVVVIESVIEIDVNIGPDVTIELGESHQLNAFVNIPMSEIDTIIWSPTIGLDCSNCLNPKVDILHEVEYVITVINLNGCVTTDRIMLRMNKTREVFIPNAFSPNDDGTNDKIMIFANDEKIKQINTFRIFDRWGEIVFEANDFQPNDPDFGWNGIFNEEILNPAVFIYFAEIEFIDGVTEIYKGDVTLMR